MQSPTTPQTPNTPRRSFSISQTLSRTTSLLQSAPQPGIDDLRLSHILNGETCSPIGFNDFAAFIANKEFSTENLLFVIWFRSYKARWDALKEEDRIRVVVPSTRMGDRYDPFGYLDKEERRGMESGSTGITFTEPFAPTRAQNPTKPPYDFKVCEWTVDGRPCACGDATHKHSSQKNPLRRLFNTPKTAHTPPPSLPIPIITNTGTPRKPPEGTVLLDPKDQPLREEAQRAFSTFLRKGGSRELGISDELRQFAKLCLTRSTAPEVFLPVYEDVYQVIETQSLPHFLTYAKANVNRPKQVYWYTVGAFDFLLGVAIFLILTLLLKPRNYGYRLTRLPSTIFTWFGSAQWYSAYRGFCSHVWGRHSRQVKPWELDHVPADEEALPTESGTFDENIFTPVMRDKDGEFVMPVEVHQLSDLGGSLSATQTSPWENAVLPTLEGKSSTEEPELSDVARRQLAIRRATVKVPDSNLAFPILDTVASPITPATPVTASTPGMQNRSEVSPFLADPFTKSRPSTTIDPERSLSADVDPRSSAATHRSSPQDLSTLITQIENTRRGSQPYQPHPPVPKARIFGPERVIEDPRIKELYERIGHDIQVVSLVVAAIWVILCFTVPMRGGSG